MQGFVHIRLDAQSIGVLRAGLGMLIRTLPPAEITRFLRLCSSPIIQGLMVIRLDAQSIGVLRAGIGKLIRTLPPPEITRFQQ
jgi:hypothetical protein